MSAPKRPDLFEWNTCLEYCNGGRSDMATAIGLTFVSQQLDAIIERLDEIKSTSSTRSTGSIRSNEEEPR